MKVRLRFHHWKKLPQILTLWLGAWVVLRFFGAHSDYRWWPLGILSGTALQLSLLQLGNLAIRRTLLGSPKANEAIGQFFIFSPLGLGLHTQRQLHISIQRNGESPEIFREERAEWEKVLPSFFFLITGLSRFSQIDSLDRWIADLKKTGRLPDRSSPEKIALVLAWLAYPIAFTYFDFWKEAILYWWLPWLTLTPAFQWQLSTAGARTSRATSLQVLETPSLP